jgi:hypothetical protein
VKEPLFLSLDEVIEIHRDQIQRYGGRSGIHDIELLKSAVAMPAAGHGGEYFHRVISVAEGKIGKPEIALFFRKNSRARE